MKPNYRFDRAERMRSKEAKRTEKREAQAARRKAGRDAPALTEAGQDPACQESNEDQDVFERTSQKEE